MKKIHNDRKYRVFTIRLEEDVIHWLKLESKNHESWNLFFRELKKNYVSMSKVIKQLLDNK